MNRNTTVAVTWNRVTILTLKTNPDPNILF